MEHVRLDSSEELALHVLLGVHNSYCENRMLPK